MEEKTQGDNESSDSFASGNNDTLNDPTYKPAEDDILEETEEDGPAKKNA